MIDPSRKYCLPPVFHEDAEILILGTMPGNDSIAADMYYANKSNHFWNYIYRILQPDYPVCKCFDMTVPKEDRYELLKRNKIAVWDVVSDCLRGGNLDSKIIAPRFNPIADFVNRSNIKAVLCTSVKSRHFLKKSEQDILIKIPIELIGSSSSSRWDNPFETMHYWSEIINKYLSL